MLASATSRTKPLGDIWSKAPAQAAPVISKLSRDTPYTCLRALETTRAPFSQGKKG